LVTLSPIDFSGFGSLSSPVALPYRAMLTPLSAAGSYGAFKIHEADHYAYWRKLRAADAVPAGEYHDCPRGRVSYDTRSRKFSLFLDRCIMKKDFIQRIMKWMNLPKANTTVETDPHYRCPVCLRGKRSFDED
jgi:hypothetical protein